jgi:acyl carrier protein
MTSTELQTEILRFIRDQLLSDRPTLELTVDDDLLGENLLDSMGIMRLVSFIDERFQFAVPPEDVTIENFLTVRDISQYLELQRNRTQPE